MERATTSELRPDQAEVVEQFLRYAASGGDGARWAHIVLPPRTGKTVIAAHIAARLGAHAAFVVPTRVLVHQTRRELARHTPGIPVGAHFGEEHETVPHGLNLTTYASLDRHRLDWPQDLRRARVVFVDEAHHALTAKRRRALRDAFDPAAIRVALTATPDYDAWRRLEHVFPDRVARVELRDAVARGLVAPTTVRVAEVDIDGSAIELQGGEYDPGQLTRLMSHAPFHQAALHFRYVADHRDIPCLIACVSRQQAHDLAAFFARHGPPDRPRPEVIVGETPPAVRQRVLADFEAGRIDTLVQVGVLVEGWTSARCKLLIDLAPGRSRVRATQKYFRALTRDGDAVARLVVLLPRDLPRPPVLPMDLLLAPGEVYACGDLIGAGTRRPVSRLPCPVARVRLMQQVVIHAPLGMPTLDPAALDDVREVLASGRTFSPRSLPGRMALEAMYFQHPTFSGSGRTLLRWLGVPRQTGAYEAWLARLYPDQVADLLLGSPPTSPAADSWVPWDEAAAQEAVRLGSLAPAATPEDVVALVHHARLALHLLDQLNPRLRRMVRGMCGFDGEDATRTELAEREEISSSRASQLIWQAMRLLRRALLEAELACAGSDGHVVAVLTRDHPPANHPWLREAEALRGTDPPGALACVRKLLAHQPDNVQAHAVAAEVLTRLARPDLAAPHIDAVARSRLPAVRLGLARTLARAGLADAARQLALHDPPLYAWRVALVLGWLGEEEAALQYLEDAEDALDGASRYHLALLRHRAGLPARDAVLRALAAYPHLGQLLGSGHRFTGMAYEDEAGALWQATPGALALLRACEEAPAHP